MRKFSFKAVSTATLIWFIIAIIWFVDGFYLMGTESKTAEKFMTYEYTLIRKSGMKTTQPSGETRTVTCPKCGAPVDINKSAECEYCGNILTVDAAEWTISNIKGISQRTM